MPELNGIEFLKLVKEVSPMTTRMLLTGYANLDVDLAAINEGHVYKFTQKPWDGDDIKLEIQKYQLLLIF